jgi:Fic/DOC family
MGRGETTEIFALERGEAFEALLGNLDQTVFGGPAYPSVESKVAHLLYFVIKNHPFTDGNKRSGAFLFVRFSKSEWPFAGQQRVSHNQRYRTCRLSVVNRRIRRRAKGNDDPTDNEYAS